jgi:DNA-binding MarR family transcriptional regulator
MTLQKKLRNYLLEVLQIDIGEPKSEFFGKLPSYLAYGYDYYITRLYGSDIILMFMKDDDATPGMVQKDYTRAKELLDNSDLVLVAETIPSYDRQRLIGYGVQFIVPGTQMFMPMIHIDLRERFLQPKKAKENLRISAQPVLLAGMYGLLKQSFSIKDLMHEFSLSKSNVKRVFDDLEALGLIETYTEVRERYARFNYSGKELWDKTQHLLKSPVKKKVYIKELPNILFNFQCISGLTALSHYSMLVAPKLETRAISEKEWKSVKGYEITQYPDEAIIEYEIWDYDPRYFVNNDVVDKISLYLSLKDDEDERVQGELERMMETIQW